MIGLSYPFVLAATAHIYLPVYFRWLWPFQSAIIKLIGIPKLWTGRIIYSSMVPNVCPGTEYKQGRTFLSEGEIFTFRDHREEGQMSAERSEARQSFWTEIKEREKFSQGKKSVRDCTFRPWIHNCHHGGHIFSLCRSLFNHQSIICITFTFLWMPLAKMSFMDAPFPNSTYLHSFTPF